MSRWNCCRVISHYSQRSTILRRRTSPPQSHLRKVHRQPHGRNCTRPLCVLAMQCPLQRSPITQPWVCYIHTAVPHSSYTLGLHCVVWCLTPEKQICLFPLGIPPPQFKKSSSAHLTHHSKWDNQCTYTELLQLFLKDTLIQTGVWSLQSLDT